MAQKPKKHSNKRNSSKYKWVILATNYGSDIEYKTSGFSKYGYGEIVVVGKKEDSEKIAYLINTFGRMFARGEKFPGHHTHCIDNARGETQVVFNVIYGAYSSGEKWIQLIPKFGEV